MRNIRPALVIPLLTALVAFQLLAGVPLCREWARGFEPRAGTAAAELSAAPGDHGGAHGHHEHPAGGHVECPDTFLSSAPQALPAQAAAGPAPAQPSQTAPFPSYEVPTPVPISLSSCAPRSV